VTGSAADGSGGNVATGQARADGSGGMVISTKRFFFRQVDPTMSNPYSVLDLEPGADEATIRKRYLQLVRQYPPETSPEKAAQIRAAYDRLRDPISRLKNELFDTHSTDSLESLTREFSTFSTTQRLPTSVLLSLGES
jgi:DnaJ-class molecular chaperone